ncbi:IPT/TIG domain-containing protein, partial [Acidobacteria bacterium AH-259-D05]|nr:IPT/TIG domain-containing protein [Acidobacteria bacterium AH-259-D05]
MCLIKRSPLTKLAVLMGVLTALTLLVYSQTVEEGYAILTADTGSALPQGTALFSSTNADGVLVWEAGVAAVEPLSSGRLFVDQQGGTLRTALALVNPSLQSVTVTLILRDASGNEVERQDQVFAPGQHDALYVDQLFSGLQNFTGSLTFQTQASEEKLAAVTLRQNANLLGEPIFATLPVVDLTAAASTESIILPHVAAGVGLSTQLVLINASQERVAGQIQLFDNEGAGLELELDGSLGTAFPYQIEANGTFRGTLTRSTGQTEGYVVVTLQEGSRTPSGSAIFQFTFGEAVISEAGVENITPTLAARIFVDQVGTQTGVAVVNPQGTGITVTFDLLDANGGFLQSKTRELAARGHLAFLVEDLFTEVGDGFSGLMEITSSVAIVPVTLKLTTNARNHPILTTLPIVDLTQAVTATSLIFPEIGFGEFPDGTSFSTRLLLINPDGASQASGKLAFFQSDGSALVVPLEQEAASEFAYLIPAGGGREFRPGITTSPIAEIILDPANPASREVVVNVGNTLQLTPRVLDSAGKEVTGVALSYSSLSPGIATVEAFGGRITGKKEGFSTLTVTAGGVVKTVTITVVKVTSGAAGFEITGVVQDLARRLYLANTQDHTILLAQDLEAMPELYAGVPQSPGLENNERLKSLFRNPGYLAFNQAQGTLYVSDGANHVIRLVEPGPGGQVETLAGTGQSGSADGSLSQASFNNPQGIALDNRGNLWVTDSGNHTIRRINLITGVVETIAGKAGSPDLLDGTGEEARFNSPSGIAIEGDSLAQQLERQRRGEPPPRVSVVVADTGNGVIRRVKESGEVETVGAVQQSAGRRKGKRDSFGLVQAAVSFNEPTGVAVDPFGNIYVTEPDSGQVKAILQNGDVASVAQANTFVGPKGIVVGERGRVVVADANRAFQQVAYGVPQITSITPDQVSNKGGAVIIIEGKNFAPDSLVVVAGLVIVDLQIQDTQTISFVSPTLPSGRTTVTVQNRGGLGQSSLLVDAIPLKELPEGQITTVAGGTTFTGDGSDALAASTAQPRGIVLDAEGNLYIADTFNARIRKVDAATGIITTVAGSGQRDFSGDGGPATAAALFSPRGVAVDGAGNLLIADTDNQRIRKVDAITGVITTVAGSGCDSRFDDCQVGDGGPAAAAALFFPRGVVVDGAGNLFIVDTSNHRIRKVDAAT